MNSLGINATGAAVDAIDRHVATLVNDRVASRLGEQDATLWGTEAESEASRRLGWVDPFEATRAILPELFEMREELHAENIHRVVLAGMGGSSLAPEVIAGAAGVELTVLDSTDPEMIGNVLAAGVKDAVLVVASKSGSTVETDSQRRAFARACEDAGLDPRQHLIVVTDPGSPLDELARSEGYRAVFNADPSVGGRYSALTAFGIVPTALAGVDVEKLLDEAEEVLDLLLTDDTDNIGLRLGAAIGGTAPLRDKLVISVLDQDLPGFGDWAEQLIAESTGKNDTGLLPVVVETGAPEISSSAADLLQVEIIPDVDQPLDGQTELFDVDAAQRQAPDHGVQVYGPLGAQFLLWEFATVIAGRLLQVNPFDQPDVESAKVAARALLDATPEPEVAQAQLNGIEIFGPGSVTAPAQGEPAGTVAALVDVLSATLELIPEHGYLSVQAYLDRLNNSDLAAMRGQLASATDRPVTFGWGPRFLHSTGQFHKGGPKVGVFLQITGDSFADLEVPGRPFSFGQLITAQAAGDARVLSDHGMTVVRLHVQDRQRGLQQVLEAAQRISQG